MPWFQSLFNDTECCAMRSQEHRRFDGRFPSAPGDPRHQGKAKHRQELVSMKLSDTFFLQIAEHCVNDPNIARRIEDDRTCPLIWGDARSLRFQFLQMCIRDRYDQCREIWTKLNEFERRDFVAVSKYGPPSQDYFLNIMVNDEQLWKEVSDDESTASESNFTYLSSNSSASARS